MFTNEIGLHSVLLTMFIERKLKWYGHVTRSNTIAEMILHVTVDGRRGRPRTQWQDNIVEWTGL